MKTFTASLLLALLSTNAHAELVKVTLAPDPWNGVDSVTTEIECQKRCAISFAGPVIDGEIQALAAPFSITNDVGVHLNIQDGGIIVTTSWKQLDSDKISSFLSWNQWIGLPGDKDMQNMILQNYKNSELSTMVPYKPNPWFKNLTLDGYPDSPKLTVTCLDCKY